MASAAAATLLATTPAAAAVFINVGDSANIVFGGTEAGTSANLLLTLTGEDSATNVFSFSYTLTNTSNAALNPTSRVRGFAFNDIGVSTTTGSASTADANGFNQIGFNIASYSGGLGPRDVCLFRSPGSCTGGNSGATIGNPATGSFTLDYAGSGMTQLTLDNFAVRYQSTGVQGEGSGVGEPITPAIPEPSTWAMLLFGFGGIGFAMRRRKGAGQTQRVRVAYS
jgi:hypothetical protein